MPDDHHQYISPAGDSGQHIEFLAIRDPDHHLALARNRWVDSRKPKATSRKL
jgi:hypothetical protein